jgi:phosphoserine phosphatase
MDVMAQKWGQEKDLDLIREIFQVFNDDFIKGVPVTDILRFIDKYAGSEMVQGKLVIELLDIVKALSLKGKHVGIFSAACRYPIEKVIQIAGYDKYFDFIEADEIYQEDGKATGFGLNIYGRKHLYMKEIIEKKTINPDELAYIADTEDEAGCFEMVRYPIVSLIASDEVKRKFAREYKAFVPENMQDLERYLNKT